MNEVELRNRQKEYARLIVNRGINLKKGQNLIIHCDVDCADFSRLVTEEAFNSGARDVLINWVDRKTSEIRVRNAAMSVFEEIPAFRAASQNDYANENTCWLRLLTVALPPEDLDPKKMGAELRAWSAAIKPMVDMRMSNTVRWNIAAVATPEWAAMVYPELPADEALASLWKDILSCTRTLEGDPIENWKKHITQNTSYMNTLNSLNLKTLVFKNSIGTDFSLDLVKNYLFLATETKSPNGTPFLPNFPSEEIYSGPDKNSANGVVVCSKPLFYNSTLVEGLKFTFKDGAVVDFSADKGAGIIEQLLSTDEGSKKLGEVALVPYHSAVSDTGRVFFTTLFDENASCHLALGESYRDTIAGGHAMSKEELQANGMNDSLEHVDFMFGTADLSIVGVDYDGKETPIFVDGDWAI